MVNQDCDLPKNEVLSLSILVMGPDLDKSVFGSRIAAIIYLNGNDPDTFGFHRQIVRQNQLLNSSFASDGADQNWSTLECVAASKMINIRYNNKKLPDLSILSFCYKYCYTIQDVFYSRVLNQDIGVSRGHRY